MSGMSIFLNKSEQMRKGYLNSLEGVDVKFKEKWLKHFDFLPAFFEEIYSVCNGTKAEIAEQIYFDFLPGFRFMQVDEAIELHKVTKSQQKEYVSDLEYENIIPFLADDSGCYYAYARENHNECIVFMSEEGIEMLHSDVNMFWKTIIAFYEEGVYFLDEDGFLTYDFEKEGEVGRKYNMGIVYWN